MYAYTADKWRSTIQIKIYPSRLLVRHTNAEGVEVRFILLCVQP